MKYFLPFATMFLSKNKTQAYWTDQVQDCFLHSWGRMGYFIFNSCCERVDLTCQSMTVTQEICLCSWNSSTDKTNNVQRLAVLIPTFSGKPRQTLQDFTLLRELFRYHNPLLKVDTLTHLPWLDCLFFIGKCICKSCWSISIRSHQYMQSYHEWGPCRTVVLGDWMQEPCLEQQVHSHPPVFVLVFNQSLCNSYYYAC